MPTVPDLIVAFGGCWIHDLWKREKALSKPLLDFDGHRPQSLGAFLERNDRKLVI